MARPRESPPVESSARRCQCVPISRFRIPLERCPALTVLILGSITWQRLGELATDIFELGVHRDTASSTPLPLFILESRRRLFAAAYQLDKSIGTFLRR